jgi:hypothetical protein
MDFNLILDIAVGVVLAAAAYFVVMLVIAVLMR